MYCIKCPFLATLLSYKSKYFSYLNDLERGLIEGDRLPSSSIKLGLESLEEKCRWWYKRGSSWAGVPACTATCCCGQATAPAPAAAAAAPSWCNLSCDEHWDWKRNPRSLVVCYSEPYMALLLLSNWTLDYRDVWAARSGTITWGWKTSHWPSSPIDLFHVGKGELIGRHFGGINRADIGSYWTMTTRQCWWSLNDHRLAMPGGGWRSSSWTGQWQLFL